MPGPLTIFARVDCWEATLNHEKGRNEANSYLSSPAPACQERQARLSRGTTLCQSRRSF